MHGVDNNDAASRWQRWRELAESGAIQAVGSAAILLTTVLLARVAGPSVQGAFSLVRAELDTLTAFCLLGLPQAAFYFSHRGELSVATGRRIAFLLALLAGSGVLFWRMVNTWTESPADNNSQQAVAYSIAIFCMVAYSVMRGLTLAQQSSRLFSLFSALPSLLLMVSIITILSALSNWQLSKVGISWIFAGSYGLCLVLGYFWLHPASATPAGNLTIPLLRSMLRYGAATWIVSLCQAASVLIVLNWIEARFGLASAGIFAAGLALVTLAITPINLVVPILFRRWAGMSAHAQKREFVESAVILTGIALAALGTLLTWGTQVVGTVFGVEYAPSAGVFALLCLGIIPQGVFRLWGVHFNALGRPEAAIIIESSRLLLLVLGLLTAGNTLDVVIWVWVGSELCVLMAGIAVYIRCAQSIDNSCDPGRVRRTHSP